MSPTFISLLYFGLRLGHTMEMDNGLLSKPQLQVLPSPVMAPWGKVTFRCSLPPDSDPQPVTFNLYKDWDPRPVDVRPGEQTKADFFFGFLKPKHSGNYTCTYQKTSGSHRVSEPSESLELLVTETLPKPFISALPSQLVVSGGNVTLLCWGSIQRVRFALYKKGEERCLGIRESTQGGAEFHLTYVNIKDAGHYNCRYNLGSESHVFTPPSDLLELTVLHEEQRKKDSLERQHCWRGETGHGRGESEEMLVNSSLPSSSISVYQYIRITLSHVFMVILLFLLLAYLSHQ